MPPMHCVPPTRPRGPYFGPSYLGSASTSGADPWWFGDVLKVFPKHIASAPTAGGTGGYTELPKMGGHCLYPCSGKLFTPLITSAHSDPRRHAQPRPTGPGSPHALCAHTTSRRSLTKSLLARSGRPKIALSRGHFDPAHQIPS